MRDGKRNTTSTWILREQKQQWGRFQPGRKRDTNCTRILQKGKTRMETGKSVELPQKPAPEYTSSFGETQSEKHWIFTDQPT